MNQVMIAGLGYKTDNILSKPFFLLPTMITECNCVVLKNYVKTADVFSLMIIFKTKHFTGKKKV